MIKTNLPIAGRIAFVAVLIFSSIFYFSNCTNTGDAGGPEVEATSPYDNLFMMAPPHDVSSSNPSRMELAIFAWQELIALNWKSNYNTTTHTRGEPDDSWSWSSPGPFPDNPVVWETYAHRTELSPYGSGVPTKPFNSAPEYVFEPGKVTYANGARQNLFNCLDEDNEIGSCDLYGYPQSEYDTTGNLILYQAKTNASEYNYIKSNFPNSDSLGNAATRTKNNIASSNNYNPQKPKDNCNCPNSIVCLPCGKNGGAEEGAIEIKTAWRKARTSDNLNDYFHREVIYYNKEGAGLKGYNGTFLLIGIHIIHKTQNVPDFIFATFEHENVTSSDANFHYIALKSSADETPGLWDQVQRLHPVDSLMYYTVSDSVHARIAKMNSASVWQNYRLTGVQSQITNYADNTTVPSYFLANFVIESDSSLNNFYGSFGKPHDPSILNTLDVLKEKQYNMGGCKGCHGVAQQGGTDFSFILQAQPKEPDPFLYQ